MTEQGRMVALGAQRVLQPGRLRWLRALGWMVGLAVIVIVVFGMAAAAGFALASVVTDTPFRPQAISEPGGLSAAIGLGVASLAALGIYAIAVRLAENRRVGELGLAYLAPDLGAGLAAGAGMMALTVAIMGLGGWVTITPQPVSAIWGAVALTIQSGSFEELLFRLVIFRLVWRAFGPWAAIVISALMFGIVHITNPNSSMFAALCIAVEAGVMLATFYILTGRAWASMGVHAGWNFTQGWIFGAAVSGTGGFAGGPLLTVPVLGVPDWLSGGAFGPEASLAGLIVGCGFGGWLLWLGVRRGRLDAAPGASRVAVPDSGSEAAG